MFLYYSFEARSLRFTFITTPCEKSVLFFLCSIGQANYAPFSLCYVNHKNKATLIFLIHIFQHFFLPFIIAGFLAKL